jgi:hypothetical protein
VSFFSGNLMLNVAPPPAVATIEITPVSCAIEEVTLDDEAWLVTDDEELEVALKSLSSRIE